MLCRPTYDGPTGVSRWELLVDDVTPGHLLRGVNEVTFADDVVAVEHGVSLVSGQLAGHALRNARANEVADGRAPQVVRDAAGAAGLSVRHLPWDWTSTGSL